MSRILVVYYSRTGTTHRVAQALAESLGADLDEIQEHSSRIGVGGYARSMLEAITKGIPSIQTQHDPRDYDQIVIGTPVWAGTMASPVRSYLFLHHGRLPRVAFFAVMAGRGAQEVLREMKLFCGAEQAPTLFVTQGEVEKGRATQTLDVFVRDLKESIDERRHSVAA